MIYEDVIRIPAPNLHIEVADADGRTISRQSVRNRVTDVGKNIIRDLLLNDGPGLGFMGVGTGSDPTSATDTALKNEVFRYPITRRTAGSGKANFKLFLSTADANGYLLAEIGIWRGATYGLSLPAGLGFLFARAVFTPINKTNLVQVTFSWDFSISVATT